MALEELGALRVGCPVFPKWGQRYGDSGVLLRNDGDSGSEAGSPEKEQHLGELWEVALGLVQEYGLPAHL